MRKVVIRDLRHESQLLQWLTTHVGRYYNHSMGAHRGKGWRMVKIVDGLGDPWSVHVEIEDENLMTLFILTWANDA